MFSGPSQGEAACRAAVLYRLLSLEGLLRPLEIEESLAIIRRWRFEISKVEEVSYSSHRSMTEAFGACWILASSSLNQLMNS